MRVYLISEVLNMKKSLLCLLLSGLFITSVNNAMAQNSSSMRIIGSVVASSCDIDTSGFSNISMPSVTQKDFTGKGSTAGEQSFEVKVSDCPNTVNSARVSVSGKSDATDANLLAVDTGENMATGIAIGITAQGSQLPVNTGKSIPRQVKNGEATFEMTAKYIATSDVVVSGGVSATAQINVTYL